MSPHYLVKFISTACLPLRSRRRHLSNDDCLEDNREHFQNCMYSAVLCMTVVHSDTHTRQQFLKLSVDLALALVFVCLFKFNILCVFQFCSCTVCFCCVRFNFLSTMPRDWLGRTSPKWPILCRVGRKNLTQSINWVSVVVFVDVFELECNVATFRRYANSAAVKLSENFALQQLLKSASFLYQDIIFKMESLLATVYLCQFMFVPETLLQSVYNCTCKSKYSQCFHCWII